jgi:CRP/FNR family cyclic AMP-dependent transcriptional regulator
MLLDEETRRLLEALGSEAEFPAGQVLIEHNTPAAGLYLILEGRVAIHAHGAELEAGPGEVVGEMALVRGGPRRARVITVTPVRAVSVAREHVDPELTARLSSLWES